MSESVVVQIFQARQRQQGILVAEDRLDHVLGQRFYTVNLNFLPKTNIVEHQPGNFLGFHMQPAGARRFVLELDHHRLFSALLGDLRQASFKIGVNLGLRPRFPDIGALQVVDVHARFELVGANLLDHASDSSRLPQMLGNMDEMCGKPL